MQGRKCEILDAVEKLDRGEQVSDSYMNVLLELAEVMKTSSKCGLGQTSANPFVIFIKTLGKTSKIKGERAQTKP